MFKIEVKGRALVRGGGDVGNNPSGRGEGDSPGPGRSGGLSH